MVDCRMPGVDLKTRAIVKFKGRVSCHAPRTHKQEQEQEQEQEQKRHFCLLR